MNTINKLIAISATLFAMTLPSNAQSTKGSQDFALFNAVEISNYFDATLVQGDSYTAEWTVDEALGDYLEIYVKGKVLYVGLTKDGAAFVKKNYKGKDADIPSLKVTITLPEFKKLTLKDNAIAHAGEQTLHVQDFIIDLSDKSSVTELRLESNGTFTASLSKSSKANVNVLAKTIVGSTDNSSSLTMEQVSKALTLTSAGSSVQNIKGEGHNVSVNTKGSSKLFMSGTGIDLQMEGQGSSEFNGVDFSVNTASAKLNGSTVYVNADNEISVDIKSGSRLVFLGNPEIKIVDVAKSSITRYDNVKK